MIFPRTARRLAAIAAVVLVPACSSNETAPEDHTPVTYTVLVDGAESTAPYTLTAGQTVRLRLKFFNAASGDLDDVEGEHFGGLTFAPTSLATVARVTGHNYRFDVTAGTAGAGTVQVSFGHDAQADEHSFTPAAVTVQAP
jgi:ABC-type glycerol-3-phosphate transport system substrate-binding protein